VDHTRGLEFGSILSRVYGLGLRTVPKKERARALSLEVIWLISDLLQFFDGIGVAHTIVPYPA
jgi:hypothetical protein